MVHAIVKKLGSLLFLILFLAAGAMALQKSRGGSAAIVLGGQRAQSVELEQLKRHLGEERGLVAQMAQTLAGFLRLDFGETIRGKPVLADVRRAIGFTLVLAFWAAVFALLYGVFPGVASSVYPRFGAWFSRLNYAMLSLPVFVVALLFLWLFSLWLNWVSPGGVFSRVWFLLPALALGFKSGARLALFVKEFFGREMGKPYVTTAKAFGYAPVKIYYIYILKNMALPAISFWLLDFASYLSGAAIVETIFSIPGVGSLLLKSLLEYDLNLMIGILVCVSVLIYCVSLMQEWLDFIYQRYFDAEGDSL